jgi:RNA polymerase sigma-70 factor (ECF subfamily)
MGAQGGARLRQQPPAQGAQRGAGRAAARSRPDVPAPTGDAVDISRALAALPRAQREVVVLQGLGLGVADIASELGVAVGTVKSRLSRARAALVPC